MVCHMDGSCDGIKVEGSTTVTDRPGRPGTPMIHQIKLQCSESQVKKYVIQSYNITKIENDAPKQRYKRQERYRISCSKFEASGGSARGFEKR